MSVVLEDITFLQSGFTIRKMEKRKKKLQECEKRGKAQV